MAADKCLKCGSADTVRHNPTATLKPNWLHCRGCGQCYPTEEQPSVVSEPEDEEEQEEAGEEEPAPRRTRSGRYS